jgi:hypothetical protein
MRIISHTFLCSSVVEQSAVNRWVASSNLAGGANFYQITYNVCYTTFMNINIHIKGSKTSLLSIGFLALCTSAFIAHYSHSSIFTSQVSDRTTTKQKCSDIDGAAETTNEDRYIKSYVLGTGVFSHEENISDQIHVGTLYDECNGNQLIEQACTSPGTECSFAGKCNSTFIIDCLYGCTEGACKRKNPSAVEPETCTDSDGGNKPNIQGFITTRRYNKDIGRMHEMTIADECLGSMVSENYCLRNEHGETVYRGETHDCPNDCKNGACIEPKTPLNTCTDPDGGQNTAKRTLVRFALFDFQGSKSEYTAEDFCKDETTLSEAVCESYIDGRNGVGQKFVEIPCLFGCKDGVCAKEVKNETCTDSDGGKSTMVRGNIHSYSLEISTNKMSDVSFLDVCVGSILHEGYCIPEDQGQGKMYSRFDTENIDCPYGCVDGACSEVLSTPPVIAPPVIAPSTIALPIIAQPACPQPMCVDAKHGCWVRHDPTLDADGCLKYLCGIEVCDSDEKEENFSDLSEKTDIGIAAASLREQGIIGGYPDGEFKAKKSVNRAEAAKFLIVARYDNVPNSSANIFSDVVPGQWYVKYIVFASNQGIINGYSNGSFQPGNTVNTVEFLKMLALTFDLELNRFHKYQDVPVESWFEEYAGIAWQYDLFPERGILTLDPSRKLTRGEVAIAIYKILKANNANN